MAGVGIVTVLAVRFVAGQFHSDDNSRHLAQQISDLPEAMGTETVQEELGDYETGRIWLVPKPLESRFRDLAEGMGFERPTEMGMVSAERSRVAFLLE